MPSGPGAPRDEQLVDSTSLWVAMGAKGDGANEDGSHLQLTRAAHLQLTRAAHRGVGPRPKGPWHPCLGGNTLARRLVGVRCLPGCSLGNPPRMAPPHLGARLCRLLVVTIPILQICTSHIVDSFLPIVCCRLQSSILLKIRPPEESLHQTCRTFRAESDSSTPEVSGGLLVTVFEAFRQTPETAA